MKNNLKYIIALFISSSLFIACDEQLNLEPAQSISESKALETDKNVKNTLRGAYSIYRNRAIYGGNVLTNSELLGGDGEILWVGTFSGPRQIFNKAMFAPNEDVRAHWMDAYNMINITNNVISAISVVNDADKARIEGEALFLRSLGYFDLVRFFAKPYQAGTQNTQLGVPLVLLPTRGITDENYVSRNTVEEVYKQITDDLIKAATLLPDANGILPAKNAANGLLARVYLQQGDYAKARDAANTVIQSGRNSLRPTYAAAFNQDVPTTEDIFASEFTTQDAASGMTIFWSIPEFGGRPGDIDILPGHMALYEANDARRALFYEGGGALRSGKWNNQFGTVPIIRLAEMYLIRAESNLRLNTSTGATPLQDINTIRTRASLPAKTSVTLNDILLERRLELAHEGHKIHDIKRLKLRAGNFNFDDPKLVFPIPAREIEANNNLQQNDGY
jgi:starch-binding outer membrane protein, SusD/RagB family